MVFRGGFSISRDLVERNWRIEAVGFQDISVHFNIYLILSLSYIAFSMSLSLCFSTSICLSFGLPVEGADIAELYININNGGLRLSSVPSLCFVSKWMNGDRPI